MWKLWWEICHFVNPSKFIQSMDINIFKSYTGKAFWTCLVMIPVVISYIYFLSHKNVSQWQKLCCDITIVNQSGHRLTRPNFSMTLSTETEMSSFWWNFHHWLHWKLSKWQLPVQPVMKISSKWRHFRFSVLVTLRVARKFLASGLAASIKLNNGV